MPERLVVIKSKRQTQVEGVLLFILPLASSLLCVWLAGTPKPIFGLVPFVLFFGLPSLGNLLALRLGGELVSREERHKRMIQRLHAVPLWKNIAMGWLSAGLMFLAVFLPMGTFSENAVLFVSASLIGGLVIAVCVSLAVRRNAAVYADPVASALPPTTVRQMLREYLPGYYLMTVAAVLVGALVGRRLPRGLGMLAFLAAYWTGAILLSLRQRKKRPPLLWHHFPTGEFLLYALLAYVLPLGVAFLGMPLSDSAADGARGVAYVLLLAIFFGAGCLTGLLFALILRAIAWLNDLGPRGGHQT